VTGPPPAKTTVVDRLLGAYPLLVAYLVLLILYAWQTTKISTPWLFTDELQWAELSRGVAHHGVPQLRGQDQGFSSLYEYVLAPAWWAGSTSSGYAAAKYINAAFMTASLFPATALARLFVTRRVALACGVATAAIPSLAYTGLLIPESLAYFWSTLALWLIGRAALRPGRWSIAAAVIAVAIAPAVRSELAVLVVVGALTAAIVIATSRRGRATISSWSRAEQIGAVVLLVGFAIFLGAFGNHHSYTWQTGGHFHHRMFTYGIWALGAFTLGVGIFPCIVTLTWLFGNRFRTADDRALGALLVGAIVAFGLYTAVKASYISTNFAIRVEERNAIYIAPVVFAVVGRWALTGRARTVPLIVATAITWWLLSATPWHNYDHFYSDAPGLSVLQWLNQHAAFTTTDARWLVYSILAGSVVAILLRDHSARLGLSKLAVPAGLLLAVAVIGWNLWGEIASAQSSRAAADAQRGVLPTPPDWIDNTTGKERTMFIGQSLGGSNAFWSLEFWNQSIQDVWSVDASAPGPGPTTTPNYLDTTGAVDPQLPLDWIVAAPGVNPVGRLAAPVGGLRLYKVPHPIRIADAYGGLSTDANWMSTSAWYYRFTSAGTEPGFATVTFSRAAACGGYPPSHITITLSSLRITPEPDAQPVADKVLAVRHVVVRSDPCTAALVVKIPAQTPYRIDLAARGTFQPSEFDQRQLSAQVAFGFQPAG
jgi:hypothetical protein